MKDLKIRESDLQPQSFQRTVDRVAADGGGRLIVPAGRWVVGEASLRTGVRLQLAAGCILDGRLTAEGVQDIGVVGEGPDQSQVTGGLGLHRVKGVECRGWAGRVIFGEYVEGGRFAGLKLHQPPQRHGGGSVVWFYWAKDLTWEDCDLESNDDVFCLKRGGENVTLVRSRLRGRMAAPFKIGTESDGLFRDIVFTDSVIEKSDRAAITLESVDGAELCNVRIERIRMEDVNAPIFIRLGNRDRYSKGIGSIHDILIADVQGFGDKMDEGFGSCISGVPGHPVKNIVLRDIRFRSRGGQSSDLAKRVVPERAEMYPEFDMFGRMPAHGLFARHVKGLRLERCSWTTAQPDGRPALVVEDTENVEAVATDAPQVRTGISAPAEPAWPAGDVEKLLAAIAAAQPGETVTVEPGDYAIPRERLPIRLDRPGLTLRSRAGASRTRIRAVGARESPKDHCLIVEPKLARELDVLLWVGADGVTVSGLTLSAGVYNVYLAEASDCKITDNVFDFSKRYHLNAFRCGRLLLEGNRTRMALTNSFKLDLCEGCVVRGNAFSEETAALHLTGSCGNEIAGNRIEGVFWHGLVLGDESNGNRVVGNLFADGRLTGLQIRGSERNEIVGNEFRGQKTESVLIDTDARDNRLRGNRFHDNRGTAVSNETTHPVDAVENWWGRPEGPRVGVEVDANVLVEPWLRDPPAA